MNRKILVLSSTIEPKILASCSSIIAAFFPDKKVLVKTDRQNPDGQFKIWIERSIAKSPIFTLSLLENQNEIVQIIDSEEISDLLAISLPGKEILLQTLVKRALYIFLRGVTKKKIPWGILTGIRPGKLLPKMDDLGLKQDVQIRILTNLYMLEKEKVSLLETTAQIQRPYMQKMQERSKVISLYVMIPFCPSRCSYCSFPSQLRTTKNKDLVQTYLQTLSQEVKLTGDMMKELGLKADCLYIGGGTPTSLVEKEMQVLFQGIKQFIPLDEELEYTVEAGRPDSINKSKLLMMKEFGVNRISINPQSMQDKTLIKIGRNHSVTDILTCYEMARETGNWLINMDLILGLPGEEAQEMLDSLESVLDLKPDNLTVHALALKKGSQAWEANYGHSDQRDWTQIQQDIWQRIQGRGYRPYYLYRQKNIVGNLENVGYSLPSKECRYNMAMIEEKQMIIGLGAGASSKLLQPNLKHINFFHPLDLNRYLNCYEELYRQKKRILQIAEK